MNLQSTDFELFGLPTQFAQTPSLLQERWKALQAQAHPDNFAAQGSAAQGAADAAAHLFIARRFARRGDPLVEPAVTLQGEAVVGIELDAFLFEQALLEGVAAVAGG